MNCARAFLTVWLKLANSRPADPSSSHWYTCQTPVPLADLGAADPLGRGRGTVGQVAAHPGLELPEGSRVAPAVAFEPPAADGRQQGNQVAAVAGLLERSVQVGVLAPKHIGVGVRGQEGPDRGGGAGGACQHGLLAGVRRRHVTPRRSHDAPTAKATAAKTATTPARSSGKPAPVAATPPGTSSTATTTPEAWSAAKGCSHRWSATDPEWLAQVLPA